jgi:hypothetical protein
MNYVISSTFLLGPNFLITLIQCPLCTILNMRNQVSTTNRSNCILKFTLQQATKAHRVSNYIALLFLDPQRYMGVNAMPRLLYPRERPGTHSMILVGSQGQYGRVWKISPPPRFDSWTVQSLAIPFNDCAIPALGQTV